jgi:hypothetical protein
MIDSSLQDSKISLDKGETHGVKPFLLIAIYLVIQHPKRLELQIYSQANEKMMTFLIIYYRIF